MKKSKLAIGLMSALLSVGALAACSDVSYSPDGYILTYTGEDGVTINYTADDLFNDEFKDSSNYQTVFDAVYKIIIKNYFTETDPDEVDFGKNQLASLKTKAQVAVDGDKQTASKKAETNGSSYDTEFSAILKEKNCEDESELFDYYLYKYEEETFNDNFEKVDKNMKILKSGTSSIEDPDEFYKDNPWDGYFEEKVPYHVSHILVKIEDSNSTNYANATVSEANAKKLFTVADALRGNVYNSFADTAALSDDSAARGDLGLVDMDKTATYIDEFKYALYAFENLYGATAAAQASKISMNFKSDLISDYNKYNHLFEDEAHMEGVDDDHKYATIPFGAFKIMEDNAKRELGYKDQKVNDGDANFYPRNIYFNHFFNRHSLALVTAHPAIKETTDYYTEIDYTDSLPATLGDGEGLSKEGTGFHDFTPADGVNFTGRYLATSVKLGNKVVYRPILVVRGGSSGESGYQGIHFIVVNRSPFEFINGDPNDSSVASLENYYTTYFPSQDKYPTYPLDGGTAKLQTYVNASGDKDTYQTRAEEVKGAVKNYDSEGLKHFMFRKYLKAGKLSFQDTSLEEGLKKWMVRSEQNKEYNATVEWENKWISYIENLRQAVAIQKNKTVSKACALNFSTDKSAHGDLDDPTDLSAWNEVGGICNNGEKHS